MASDPVPPITVDDNGDIDVYADVAAACDDLEVYDIDRIEVFDGVGRRLRAEASGYRVADLVVVDDAEAVPSILRDKLVEYVRRAGPERIGVSDYRSAPLDVLLASLLQVASAEPTYDRGPRAWLDGVWRMIRGR